MCRLRRARAPSPHHEPPGTRAVAATEPGCRLYSEVSMFRPLSRPGAPLAAAALASGAMLIVSTGSAGAAAANAPTSYAGTAKGMALHLEINIPGAPAISEDIAFVNGQIVKADTTDATGTAELFH